ncbi:hypothetical protein LQZ21_11025 [Treponema sp. TIM-1]|uniref:hypothetical protein n=1 Tax=Treponema sp. TIM-1 TaxID=2898417 RepID=UPI00397FADD9
MNNLEHDRDVLRKLVERIAEIAALPVQEEKKRLWRALNGLKPERPMVTIDQVCWNEMNIEGKLDLACEDAECRAYEEKFRRILLQWDYFPVDMVVEPYIRVPMAIEPFNQDPLAVMNRIFGVVIKEQTLATDKANDVVSHNYENQFKTIEDVEKIQMPVIVHDQAETRRRMDRAAWLFDGILPLRQEGWFDHYLSVWDPIAMWMSVEGILYGIIDEPEMMHALVQRVVEGYMVMLDQLEEQGLIYAGENLIHTTGAWTDELPAPGFDPEKPRTQDVWMYAMAQALGTVSPDMYEEYEIEHLMPLFKRFGLVYYGCCDPLELKMDAVKRIPHVRKISISPWANREKMAEQIGSAYVASNKPNPAFLAGTVFNGDMVREDLERTLELCKRTGSPLEFAFKDISTVRYDPLRLKQVNDIAMKVVGS